MNYQAISVAFGLALASASLSASVYTVNTDKYFAYFEKPGRYTRGVTIPSTLLLLSKQKCNAKGAPKSAKAAAVVYLIGTADEKPSCWYTEKSNGEEIVVLCGVYGGTLDPGTASCHFVSPSRFTDTHSLPRQADF